MYFDPATGKLRSLRPDDRCIIPDMMSGPGFGGGVYHSTVEAAQIEDHTSAEFADAVTRERPLSTDRLHEYYKIQSLQSLGEINDQVSVPIWIARDGSRFKPSEDLLCYVAPAWIEHIQQAVNDINYAAPGLRLYITSDESKARVKICGTKEDSCYTMSGILKCPSRPSLYPDAAIYPNPRWIGKKRTSCHELLHALGLKHEHQRLDRDLSVDVLDVEERWKSQYRKKDNLLGITRFDPHSIMMYPEQQETLRRNSKDPVWFTKPTSEWNMEMSELDKVSLNNLYRPCRGPHYSPTKNGITGLWYCGRKFGVQYQGHNGDCGPTNGPNCPACRVLKSDRVVSLWKKGKWQGWTGGVYCGRNFGVQEPGHDGNCGPNNGPSCPQCYNELLRRS